MKIRLLAPILLVISLAGSAHAGGSTALGGAIGGAAGAVIGEAVGGREGAIIGGALGGGVGAAAGYDKGRDDRPLRDGVRYEEPGYHHEDSRRRYRDSDFCPPGQARKGRC